MELCESETLKKLMRLFAGETMARARYEYAASEAKNQGVPILERLFLYTAGQEREHGLVLWNILKSAGVGQVEAPGTYPVDLGNDLASLLTQASEYEYKEAETVYPAFADLAQEEGFPQIADRLRALGEIERTHAERFSRFAALWEQGTLFKGGGNTRWICLNCGHVLSGAEPPASCPVCSHELGYFVRLESSPYE